MPNQFDLQAEQLKRRRQIAQALRESGNEPLDYGAMAGRFVVPVSGYQHADKLLKQLLGGYEERQVRKGETKLAEEQAKAQAEWIRGITEAQTPDEVQPIASTGELIGEPTQEQVANRLSAVDTFGEATKASEAIDRNKMLAHYLKGGDLGGMPAAIGAAGLQRELFPPRPEPYTLGTDDIRYDERNRPVAFGPARVERETAGDRLLINIVDPNSPDGYRTIKRADWKGEQEYMKPNVGLATAAQMDPNTLEYAAEHYRQTGKLPPGFSRAPEVTIKIIERAALIAKDRGDNAQAASLQQQANKASQSALMQIRKQQTMVGAFERTAQKNADLALSLSGKVDRTQTPAINRWLNAGRKQIAGDVDVAKFDAANLAFMTEYAKIISGSMGNTPVSDAARAHAEDAINTAQTAEQYAGVIQTLKQDMANRMSGFEEEIDALTGRLPGADKRESATPENFDPDKETRYQEWLKANP